MIFMINIKIIMNIDLVKATEQANSLEKISDYEKAKSIIQDFSETTYYYDEKDAKPSADLVDNEDYKQLMDYILDAHFVQYAVGSTRYADTKEEKVDVFLGNIDETETDLRTFLDNFVCDTSHPDVKTYLLEDFPDPEAFAIHLLNGYFHNNFLHYLKKLG
jgi:hypothetical protein